MEQLVTTVTNTLVLSSMYILVALGFAFLFNMLGILNLAHGAIYMIGGYLCLALIRGLGIDEWIALLLATIIIAGFGVFLEKFCFRPFIGDFNRTVTICVVITIALQTGVNIIAGAEILSLPPFAKGIFKAGPLLVSYERIVTLSVGLVLLVLIIWFVNSTRWGHQLQAVSQNIEGAALQGINVHRISGIACAVGCGLAAVAGCLIGAYLSLGPFMGDYMLVKILMVVFLAGAGSITGIFIAGFALGILDGILPVLLNGAVSDAIAVGVVVLLLLIRPQGFFGHEL
jgi:branched-chain amino acid transport system permease protein